MQLVQQFYSPCKQTEMLALLVFTTLLPVAFASQFRNDNDNTEKLTFQAHACANKSALILIMLDAIAASIPNVQIRYFNLLRAFVV